MLVSVLWRLSVANIVHLDDFGKYGDYVVWLLCMCLYRRVSVRMVVVCFRGVFL